MMQHQKEILKTIKRRPAKIDVKSDPEFLYMFYYLLSKGVRESFKKPGLSDRELCEIVNLKYRPKGDKHGKR